MTWFFIGMIQRMMGAGMPNLQTLSRALTYQALVDLKKWAGGGDSGHH
jgi:hypothetical protein